MEPSKPTTSRCDRWLCNEHAEMLNTVQATVITKYVNLAWEAAEKRLQEDIRSCDKLRAALLELKTLRFQHTREAMWYAIKHTVENIENRERQLGKPILPE